MSRYTPEESALLNRLMDIPARSAELRAEFFDGKPPARPGPQRAHRAAKMYLALERDKRAWYLALQEIRAAAQRTAS